MASQKIPQSYASLVALANDAEDGAITDGAAVGLSQNTAAKIAADLRALAGYPGTPGNPVTITVPYIRALEAVTRIAAVSVEWAEPGSPKNEKPPLSQGRLFRIRPNHQPATPNRRSLDSDILNINMLDLTKQTIDLLRSAYLAFNGRNINAALMLMTPDVLWPRAFKGGFVQGPDEIRAYWTEQWTEIDPNVEPVAFHTQENGCVLVEVRQVVRSMDGDVLADEHIGHLFTLRHGLIQKMEVASLPAR